MKHGAFYSNKTIWCTSKVNKLPIYTTELIGMLLLEQSFQVNNGHFGRWELIHGDICKHVKIMCAIVVLNYEYEICLEACI